MFSTASYLSSLKQYVVDGASSLTQTNPIQNVKDTVNRKVISTKDYFYPKPEEHEMRSVVRLDGAFLAEQDIVEYATPGQALSPPNSSTNLLSSPHPSHSHNSHNSHPQSPSHHLIAPIKPSGDALAIQSWHDCGIHFIYIIYIC